LVLTSEGKYDEADEAMLEGLTIAWKVGDLKNSSFSLAFRGDIALRRGDRSRAEEIYKESAHLFLSLKNKLFLAYPKRRLGYFALERGEFQAARELFQESLDLNREGGDQRGVLATFTALAALANQLDLPGPSARLYGWVENKLETRGINLLGLDQVELNHLRAQLLARLGEPAFSTAFDEGWEMSDGQAMELAGEILREADE
jgi:tetratricopeptide (TPR) repeat protein